MSPRSNVPTRSNAQEEEEEEEPVNMAYGLYVTTTYGRFHKSEYFLVHVHGSSSES